MMACRSLLFLTLLLLTCFGLKAETIKIKVNRDTSISYHPKERNDTKGGRNAFKVKWFEEFGLLDADFSSLKGKVISKGYLYLKGVGKPVYNLNKGVDLTWISVCSVSMQWDEMKACANNNGLSDNWGWPGAKIYDVIAGNGNTVRCNNILEPINGWHRIELTAELISALINKASYGVSIMDGSGHFTLNTNFYTHEQNNQCPYFEFQTSGVDNEAPKAPQNIKIIADSLEAGLDYGAVKVSFLVPKSAASFNVSIDGKAINRWQIPFADKEGAEQTFVIRDLKPSSNSQYEISAVDANGNESQAVKVKAQASSELTVPKPDKISFKPIAGEPKSVGGVKVYAFPELMKINPVDAELLIEKHAEFKQKNAVWSGADGLVRLAAAKGEIISFQLGFDGKFKDIKINVGDLAGAAKISNSNVKIWRNWYVKGHSEYALPFTGTLSCPMEDNKIENQTHQAVTVDYNIPISTKEGVYKGSISIENGTEKLNLALEVKVYKSIIPAEIHFNPELNCYGGPGSAGSETFIKSHQLAHYNRCAINRVPYNQTGQVHQDFTPKVSEDGSVTDWSSFDKNIGGLLDGSWFKDNPRSGVPVASIYLPFHEAFPFDFKKYYKTSTKQLDPQEFRKIDRKEQQAYTISNSVKGPPIEDAMSQKYKDGFTKCVSDFYKHFNAKGWNKTIAQFYLNNKLDFGYTIWTLDEPNIYRDWEALNFFARLWKEGINDPYVYTKKGLNEIFEKGLIRKNPTFLFRGDISRMHWQGNLSDGLMNIVYVGGGGFDINRLLKNHKDRMPTILYAYGSCLNYQSNTWGNAAWCIKSFISDLDGVLPWQSLGKGINNPDPKGSGNALIVEAGEYGKAIASFRVHGLRRGAQDAELMRLLQLKNNWSRGHIGLFISQVLSLSSEYKQSFNDEAAAQRFRDLDGQKFVELKEIILMQLEK